MSQKLVIKINNANKIPATLDPETNPAAKTVTIYHWHRIIACLFFLALTLALIGWYILNYNPDDTSKATEVLTAQSEALPEKSLVPPDKDSALPKESAEIQADAVSEVNEGSLTLNREVVDNIDIPAISEPKAASEESQMDIVSSRKDDDVPTGELLEMEKQVKTAVDSTKEGAKENSIAGISTSHATVSTQEIESSISTSEQGKPVIKVLTPNFTRVTLARDVRDYEPVNEVLDTVEMGDEHLIKVVVFTEMSNFEGKEVFHNWYLDNKPMARVRIRPHRSPMRASSSKYIDQSMTGDWDVKITNKSNILLAEVTFKVN